MVHHYRQQLELELVADLRAQVRVQVQKFSEPVFSEPVVAVFEELGNSEATNAVFSIEEFLPERNGPRIREQQLAVQE